MKVFLSHSTKDKQFVQTLAAELEAENIQSWICEGDVEFGGNFVAKIEEGRTLPSCFGRPEAARSDWTRLGIVLLRDCEVPELAARLEKQHSEDCGVIRVCVAPECIAHQVDPIFHCGWYSEFSPD